MSEVTSWGVLYAQLDAPSRLGDYAVAMARATTRRKVHDAVLSLAREGHVGSLSMEGVAARAGISKQTLYRSWPTTGDILFDALLARSEDGDGVVEIPDTGDLRADLRLLA